MALKSTIFKAELSVADIGRGHYGDYTLTIARHPSETDERMMVRLLAFALNASDTIAFGKGLSTEDEPDLAQRALTRAIAVWFDSETMRIVLASESAATSTQFCGRSST